MGNRETESAALQPGQLWYHELIDMHAFLVGFSTFDEQAPVFQFLDGDVVDTALLKSETAYLNLVYQPAPETVETQRPRIEDACPADKHTFMAVNPPEFLDFRLQCADCGLSVEALLTFGQADVEEDLPVTCAHCGDVIQSQEDRTVIRDAYACDDCVPRSEP